MARRKRLEYIAAGPPGRCWQDMTSCGVCDTRTAMFMPQDVPRCRLHGGRDLRKGEKLPSKAPGSLSISLDGSRPNQ